jgi:alpha-galactosidase
MTVNEGGVMHCDLFGEGNRWLKSVELKCIGEQPLQTAEIDSSVLAEAGKQISIRCAIPIIDLQGYWTPNLYRPKMQLDWVATFSSAAHCNFPFIVFFDLAYKNKGAIALTNLIDDATVTMKMNQAQASYELDFTIAITPATASFQIVADFQAGLWSDTVSRYRAAILPEGTPTYPNGAWLPVFCTWYAVHAEVQLAWLEANALAARELGFGTFIVDDGWCFDEMKRVHPQTISSWYNNIGDWKVSEKKLPNFKQHIARVQASGLNYMVWVAPFFAGEKSQLYAEHQAACLGSLHEGYKVFDPAHAAIAKQSQERLISLMRDLNLDGLKIDFIDAVPQSVQTPRGRDVLTYVKTLIAGLRTVRPEALIEFRQNYTTPIMLGLATQFRAMDCPFDFMENLHRIAQIRICLGDRVPVHADPAYWHPQELPVNISRHMICALAGVPMVSMSLPELPPEQKMIIRNWLAFYTEHLATFRDGHWDVRYQGASLSFLSVETADEKIVFLCVAEAFESAVGTFCGNVHMLNLSPVPIPTNDGIAFDCCGTQLDQRTVPCGGRMVCTFG